jgi:Malonyl-CoA decarboxylase C-terminal domain
MIGYIRVIDKLDDNLLYVIKDDPVRPNMPKEERVNDNSRVVVLLENGTINPLAVACVKFLNSIPSNIEELTTGVSKFNTAVFYTIWSYCPGTAGALIYEAMDYIKKHLPHITTFVTYSPKTEMARKFHTKNGATVYRTNEDSVNYLYQ